MTDKKADVELLKGFHEWHVEYCSRHPELASLHGFGDDEQFQRGWQAGMLAGRDSVQPAAVDEAMVKAAQEQISEGLGAYLRKFTDSEAAKHAREHLHQMPASEWSGMTRMLAEEAVGAALAAQQGGDTDG